MFEPYKGTQSAKKSTLSAFGGHSATRAQNLTSASWAEDGTPASTFLIPGCIFGDREAPRWAKATSVEQCQTSSRPKLSQEFFSSGDNGKNLTT